jgi:hypothetical protein
VDVQIRAVLPAALTQANGLNIAIGKQVTDSKTGVDASRTDKTAIPSAKIYNLTYTIQSLLLYLISVKNFSFNRTFCIDYIRVPQIFKKIWDPPQNVRRQNNYMNQVPHWGPTNSRCHPLFKLNLSRKSPSLCF